LKSYRRENDLNCFPDTKNIAYFIFRIYISFVLINKNARKKMAKKIKSPEEVQRLKYEIWGDILPSGATALDALSETAAANVIVAEGDSWFDYPPGLDILDNLKQKYKYKIHKVAEAGDSLENMSFGTKTRRNFSRETPPLEETLVAIAKYKTKVFLLSAGGNDIAGAELESYLNHGDSGLQPLRRDFAKYVFSTVARRAYENIFTRAWSLDSNIHIISHGYGYAIPDGRAVFNFLGFNFGDPGCVRHLPEKISRTRASPKA
jgi:hypothetical protein